MKSIPELRPAEPGCSKHQSSHVSLMALLSVAVAILLGLAGVIAAQTSRPAPASGGIPIKPVNGGDILTAPRPGDNRLRTADLMYTGVWRRSAGAKATEKNRLIHSEGWDSFVSQWDSLSKNGYRLINIETTPVNGVTVYSGIFEPGSGGYALISLPSWKAFSDYWVDSLKKGLALIDIEILKEGGTAFFIGVYREAPGGQLMIRTANYNELESDIQTFHNHGFHLIHVESDTADGSRMWTGLWSSGAQGEYFYRLNGWPAFTQKWNELAKTGYRLVDVARYDENGETTYMGIWNAGNEPYALWSVSRLSDFKTKLAELEKDDIQLIDLEITPLPGLQSATVWLPGYSQQQTIHYRQTIEGMPLIDGDVMVDLNWTPFKGGGPANLGGQVGQATQPLTSVATAHLWPQGIIPFEISDEFIPADRKKICSAIKSLDGQTDLTFVERTTEPDFVRYVPTDDGCHSAVGWDGGRRRIFLDANGCLAAGTVKHETLHAAGFHHEMTRDDRDGFIDILWDNIEDGKKYNFEKKPGETFDKTSYDFRSVMHYSSNAFGKDGAQTIIPKVAGVNASDLGGSDLSPLDIKGVNLAYQAKISDRDLVQKGAPPVVLETTYDRCRNDTVTVGGLVVAKNKFPGVTVPLSHNQFNWFCGNSQESATCAQGTTHVSATLDNDGRIEWNCLMKLPAPGIQYLGTEIDRCRRDALEVGATTGHVSIGQGQATFVEVPDRRIKWWCGGTEESATLPPGTRFVRVLWTPWNNGEIQWQSFTAGAPPRYCR